jgi:valyl-tRNA synthetase
VEWLKGVVVGVRNIRGEANIKPGQAVPLLLQGGGDADRTLAATTDALLRRLAKLDDIQWLDDDAEPPANALALVGELKVMIPLAGLIDVAAEKERLGKELDKLAGEIRRLEGKLGNDKFVANAPEAVVQKERDKLADAVARRDTMAAQLEAL